MATRATVAAGRSSDTTGGRNTSPRPDRTAALDEERLANALRIAVDADQHTDLVYSGVVSVEAHRESFARRVAKAYAALAPTPDEAP
jgi:hypothetical protein